MAPFYVYVNQANFPDGKIQVIRVKLSTALTLLAALTLAGCKAPSSPPGDDTLIVSEVNGIRLTHRYAVQPPKTFTPLNQPWRALYRASVMTRPDYSGRVAGYLENGKPFTALGMADGWIAVAGGDDRELIGYVPQKAAVISERYDATLRNDRPRPRRSSKKVCVNVGGEGKACRNSSTATWIIQ